MYRLWRRVRPEFARDELLFRRFNDKQLVRGVLPPASFKFPEKNERTGQSVNRGAFSEAADVLWDGGKRHDNWGVFSIRAEIVQTDLVCPNTLRSFTFSLKHKPLSNNYSHSEVWSSELAVSKENYALPSNAVKKLLRALIAQNLEIEIQPN